MKNKDIFGWGYKFTIEPYLTEEVISFCDATDISMDCYGVGFMLAFFAIDEEKLNAFQNNYGYFPFDAYLDLWQDFQIKSEAKVSAVSYNQRNHCLKVLVEKNMISQPNKNSDVYRNAGNPYNKYILRQNNLDILV
jgi:hypothetical protein